MTSDQPAAPAVLTEPDRVAALAALDAAHRYFRANLERSWVGDYLNRRNLYAQIVPARIGHAPAGWTTTRDHLRRHGHPDTALKYAGLVRRTSKGGLVDVFRDRLMIPLRTPDSTLVGFTGRAAPIVSADTPKYLNSPAGPLFVKHHLLHGLAEDAAALRHGAMPLLVEGPLDRLAVAQACYPLHTIAVSTCGTALGPYQVQALLDLVGPDRPVAVAFDPDPAGRRATRHAWETFADAGFTHLHHVTLPEGKDPAELVRNGRGNLLQDAIYATTPLAHTAADIALPDAPAAIPADWQTSLGAAKQLFRNDLHRVPGSQVADYVAHVAHRLVLPADIATAAAADAVAGGPTPRHIINRERTPGPAPPRLHRATGRPLSINR